MHLTCHRCKNGFRITGFNLLKVWTACPVCGIDNNYAQAIEREYGVRAGKVARTVISALNDVANRSKQGDLSSAIERAAQRINEAVAEAMAA